MKRQWITAGVICICLVILGAVWLILGKSDSTDGEKAEIEIAVWNNGETTQEIQTENDQGGYILRWNEEKAEVKGMEDLPLDESVTEEIRENIESLTADQEVEDGMERLEDFGLENPKAQVQITNEKGDHISILVGDEVPGENGELRYILRENQVLIVKSSQIEELLYGGSNLLSRDLTPEYTDSEENFLITRIAIEQDEGDDLILEYENSQELAGYTVNSYQMVSPRNYPADSGVTEDVFPDLFGIEADSAAVVHPSEEEKEAAGLARPWKTLQVEYTDGSGEEQTFSLKVSRPENGMVNVMTGETDVIYACGREKLPWLEETENSLVSHTVLAADIKTIEKLEITAGAEQYVFQLQNVGTEEESIIYEGKEIEGDSFRSFYYTLAGLSADEVLFADFPDTSSLAEEVRVCYHYQDGTEDVLSCYKEDSRQIYVELNQGERGFRLSASQVETMVDTVKRLASGEEITARY